MNYLWLLLFNINPNNHSCNHDALLIQSFNSFQKSIDVIHSETRINKQDDCLACIAFQIFNSSFFNNYDHNFIDENYINSLFFSVDKNYTFSIISFKSSRAPPSDAKILS